MSAPVLQALFPTHRERPVSCQEGVAPDPAQVRELDLGLALALEPDQGLALEPEPRPVTREIVVPTEV